MAGIRPGDLDLKIEWPGSGRGLSIMVITNLMTGSESAFHTYFLVSIFNSNYYIIAFLSGFLFCIIQREFRVVIDKQ